MISSISLFKLTLIHCEHALRALSKSRGLNKAKMIKRISGGALLAAEGDKLPEALVAFSEHDLGFPARRFA